MAELDKKIAVIQNDIKYIVKSSDNIHEQVKITNGKVAENRSRIEELESIDRQSKWFIGKLMAVCTAIASIIVVIIDKLM